MKCPQCGYVFPREPYQPPNILVFLPTEFNTVAFVEAWHAFCSYRKTAGKPVTKLAVTRMVNDFIEWGVASSVKAMDNSIKQGWTGVFRPRERDQHAQARASMPVRLRNKIINRLNERKVRIMSTFPKGNYAPWAEKELAAIQKQLEKL